MEVYFVIAQAIGKAKKFKLNEGEFVIVGRDRESCQVPLADDMCSGKHMKVSLTNNCIYVEDMNSKNGIYLNGVRVIKQRMFKDDKIKLGDSMMYINAEKLTKEAETYLTYNGNFDRKNKGFTLELVTSNHADRTGISKSMVNLSRKKASQNMIKRERQRAYAKQRGAGSAKKVSKEKKQVLETIALGIDIFLSLFVFYIGILVGKVMHSDVYEELATKYSEIDILFSDEMFIYTLGSFVIASIVYSANRNNATGSIGEKLLKID